MPVSRGRSGALHRGASLRLNLPRLFGRVRGTTVKIERTLAYNDRDGQWREIRQDEIAAFTEPVVILGVPGQGKTELTKALGERPGMNYVRAGTFERHANPGSLIAAGERIVIDGADEIASAAPGGAVATVLRKLSAITGLDWERIRDLAERAGKPMSRFVVDRLLGRDGSAGADADRGDALVLDDGQQRAMHDAALRADGRDEQRPHRTACRPSRR